MWKNRLLLTIVFMFGIGTIIGYKGSNLGYIILYSVSILVILSLISIIIAPFLIKPKEFLGQLITTKNEKTNYYMEIRNKGLFFYSTVEPIFFNDKVIKYIGEQSRQGLNPLGYTKIVYQITVPYRGVYRAGIKGMIITDFLGIFSKKIIGQNAVTITVYPEYNKNTTLSIFNEAQIPSLVQNYSWEQDNTTVSDVRQYTPNDSPKKIHWQLTAKRGELIVKNYSPLVTKKVALFLDTCALNLPPKERAKLEDVMVSYIAGGVNYCAKNGLPATMVYGGNTVEQTDISHESEMERVLDILARVEFLKAESNLENLMYYTKDYNNVLYLSTVNEERYSVIQHLISYEQKTIIYYFYAEQLEISERQHAILESLNDYGVEINRIKIL